MSSSLAEAVKSFVLIFFFPSTRKVFIYSRTCHLLPETWQVRRFGSSLSVPKRCVRFWLLSRQLSLVELLRRAPSLPPLCVSLSTPVSTDLTQMRAFPVSPLRSDYRRCASPLLPPPVARVRERDRCKRARKPAAGVPCTGSSTAQDTELRRGDGRGGGSGRRRHAAASQPRVRTFTRDPVADLQEPFSFLLL